MNAPTFAQGDRVRVVAGLSKGLRGVVLYRAHDFAKGVPAYRVELGGLLRDRVIRADFLEKEIAS